VQCKGPPDDLPGKKGGKGGKKKKGQESGNLNVPFPFLPCGGGVTLHGHQLRRRKEKGKRGEKQDKGTSYFPQSTSILSENGAGTPSAIQGGRRGGKEKKKGWGGWARLKVEHRFPSQAAGQGGGEGRKKKKKKALKRQKNKAVQRGGLGAPSQSRRIVWCRGKGEKREKREEKKKKGRSEPTYLTT